MPEPAVLETRELTATFGGQVAVDRLTCAFHRGTLTAIVGPNGAGKTTYLNLISGQVRASQGEVLLEGGSLAGKSPAMRARMGLGRAFQLTSLFPSLTVLENVRLAVQSLAKGRMSPLSIAARRSDLVERAWHCLTQVRLEPRADLPAAALAHGDQRKLEIAILLALDSTVLLLDEPTAGMSADEVPAILELIHAIKSRGDKTILLVEHKMNVVRSLSDRIVVLHNGRLVADGLPAEVIAAPIVQEAYLGLGGAFRG